MSTETETPFERALLDDLLAYRQTLPAQPHRAAEKASRRRLRYVALGLAAVAVAAITATVISTGHRNATPSPHTGKAVAARMLEALTAGDDQIMVETSQNVSIHDPAGPNPTAQPQGHSVDYFDLATGKHRAIEYAPDGSIIFETASEISDGVFRTDMVIYDAQMWMTHTLPLPPGSSGAGHGDLGGTFRRMLAEGAFTLVGTETIDGESVLHLRRHITFPAGNSPVPMPAALLQTTVDLWVDASTFLPVRQTTQNGTGIATQTSTYTYLPRTGANLANLNLVVPSGFTHETGSSGSSGSTSFSSGSVTLTHP